MPDISEKIENFYLEAFASRRERDKKRIHFYGEAADHASKPLDDTSASPDALRVGGKTDDDTSSAPVDDEEKKPKKHKKEKEEGDDDAKDGDDKDPVDEADDAMESIDIDDMSNEGRLELIDAIIDSVQNGSDDDAFNDFMNSLLDKVNSYQYPDKEEEGDEDNDTSADDDASADDAAPADDTTPAPAPADAAPAPAPTPAPDKTQK